MDTVRSDGKGLSVVQRELRHRLSVDVCSVAAAKVRQEISVSEAINPSVKSRYGAVGELKVGLASSAYTDFLETKPHLDSHAVAYRNGKSCARIGIHKDFLPNG